MPSLAYLVLLKGHFPGFAAKVWCKAVRHGKAVQCCAGWLQTGYSCYFHTGVL